jgi:phosphoglycolate phosphatase-like HAD superfamily hydrolase
MKTDYQRALDYVLQELKSSEIEIDEVKKWLRIFNKKNYKHRMSFENFVLNYEVIKFFKHTNRNHSLYLEDFGEEYKSKHSDWIKNPKLTKVQQRSQEDFREFLIDDYNKDEYDSYDHFD